MTPNPHFQGIYTPLFDVEYLRNGTREGHSYNGMPVGRRMQSIKR